MPLTFLNTDITQLACDAIVNAANTDLRMGRGVCGAIFNKAGVKQLQEACDALAPIKTGEAVMTPGFNLNARCIIHTAGPIYQNHHKIEAQRLLELCYINSLTFALEAGCTTIAFPLISSGIYGYPKEDALKVATTTIQDFLYTHEMDVILVLFDKDTLFNPKHNDLQEYITTHFIQAQHVSDLLETQAFITETVQLRKSSLKQTIPELDESFSDTLMRTIDMKGFDDVTVYKRANIDRKLFSKLRKNGYMPSKRTACALCIALELNLDETNELLEKAGYTLSSSLLFDVILMFFINNNNYDIYEINEALFSYDQQLLGR